MHLLKHVMDLQCRFKLVWKLLKEKHRSIRHPEGSLDFTCISTCAVKTKVFASRRLRLIEVSKYWVGYKLDRCETRGEICGKRDLQKMIDGKYKSPCTQRAPPPPPQHKKMENGIGKVVAATDWAFAPGWIMSEWRYFFDAIPTLTYQWTFQAETINRSMLVLLLLNLFKVSKSQC